MTDHPANPPLTKSSGPDTDASAVADADPFDSLLNLEETFYQQGHALGHADGARRGLIEGRLFGLEQGFSKFSSLARLHGHSIVLGNRIPAVMSTRASSAAAEKSNGERGDDDDDAGSDSSPSPDEDPDLDLDADVRLLPLANSARLEKHVRALYALSEPASLGIRNAEDEVAELEDRARRAGAKAVILGRMVGEDIVGAERRGEEKEEEEEGSAEDARGKMAGTVGGGGGGGKGDVGIEDVGILKARH